MCTIALATRVFDAVPIALGANREERYDRPAVAPARMETDPVIYGPMDMAAGGTWIAINENGVVVAVTNREGGPPGTKSRGWLVRDTVHFTDAKSATRAATRALKSGAYTGCNLLVVDPETAIVLTWDGDLERRTLPPGIHVIVNEGINGDVAKSATLRARLETMELDSVDAWEARLLAILRDHGIGACVHGPEAGTRSSSMVSRTATGEVRWRYADGPPCETQYRPWRKSEL